MHAGFGHTQPVDVVDGSGSTSAPTEQYVLAPGGDDTDDSTDTFGLPPGLTEESRATYSKEWNKYYDFAFQRLGYVPGEHEPWDVGIL